MKPEQIDLPAIHVVKPTVGFPFWTIYDCIHGVTLLPAFSRRAAEKPVTPPTDFINPKPLSWMQSGNF